MTSTSFNVGLNTGTRASSKVLKPPGGGSSDIFGSSGGEPTEPQRKIRNHLTSSIFSGETVTPSRNKPEGDNSKGETPAVNGTSNSSSAASTPAATPAAAPPAPAAAAAPAPSAGKQRVPPGGFSSGLW